MSVTELVLQQSLILESQQRRREVWKRRVEVGYWGATVIIHLEKNSTRQVETATRWLWLNWGKQWLQIKMDGVCDPLDCKLLFGNLEIVLFCFFYGQWILEDTHTHTHIQNTKQDILSANTVKHSNISILPPSITGRQQSWCPMTRMTASLIARNTNKHGNRP